jgi:hypothetical protein
MGRLNTPAEQRATLEWANGLSIHPQPLPSQFTLRMVRDAFLGDLKRYFALCGLSRSTTAPEDLVTAAWRLVFKVRITLEQAIQNALLATIERSASIPDTLFSASFFGCSKKQGVSLRLPLTSCQPTSLCGAACYAHDVLDAGPESIVRGAVNGVVATLYECGDPQRRSTIESRLQRHVATAVRAAISETVDATASWRSPRIRFSHVGEIAAWPQFANALARMVKAASRQRVQCVVYTRHRRAADLNHELFVVNFTIDKASEERRKWATSHSRLVYSAFDGDLSPDAEVNFLEHHRWNHVAPRSGTGNVCPATVPDISERTCDSVRCDKCFQPTIVPAALMASRASSSQSDRANRDRAIVGGQ